MEYDPCASARIRDIAFQGPERSDRLYRVSSGGLLLHFLAPFLSLALLRLFRDTPPLLSRLAGDGEPRAIGVTSTVRAIASLWWRRDDRAGFFNSTVVFLTPRMSRPRLVVIFKTIHIYRSIKVTRVT